MSLAEIDNRDTRLLESFVNLQEKEEPKTFIGIY